MPNQARLNEALILLNMHYAAYAEIKPYADRHLHPHPTDTRGWSQILVSALTGIKGYARKKGPDLEDGSDVKAANCWDAIDTPRFNGCIKAGTQATTANTLDSLNDMPHLFFVMWDTTQATNQKRCRIWLVNPRSDREFRVVAGNWYEQRRNGTIISDNFQLHPPRNLDVNIFRNTCGNLHYPLLFEAHLVAGNYQVTAFNETALQTGSCQVA